MKTNYRLIILEQGNIIVSDEELKINDWKYCTIQKKPKRHGSDNQCICNGRKIITSDNPKHYLPSIDYNGLEEKFGIIDVEKLAKISGYWRLNNKYAFIEGFKKSQSLNDKKFSLEDIFKILDLHTDEAPISYLKSELSKSLQQPKVFDIEVECLIIAGKGRGIRETQIPKIINNSIKITKVL